MKKIVVVGSVNIDTMLRVRDMPSVGETIHSEEMKRSGGGKGANQAMAMALLNGNVSLIARIGGDENGNKIYQSLEKAGVNMAGVVCDNEYCTGEAYITVSDNGENNIVVYPGANYELDCEQIDKFAHLIKNADYCVLQMEIPLKTVDYVIKMCKQNNVCVVLNPSPVKPMDDEMLDGINYLVPNETELQLIAGGKNVEYNAKKLLGKGIKNVLLTLGGEGCTLFNSEVSKAFPVKPVVPKDTTAAGDSFLAGFVVGIAEGMQIDKAIELATSTAACTITKSGAQDSLPKRAEVERLINR